MEADGPHRAARAQHPRIGVPGEGVGGALPREERDGDRRDREELRVCELLAPRWAEQDLDGQRDACRGSVGVRGCLLNVLAVKHVLVSVYRARPPLNAYLL